MGMCPYAWRRGGRQMNMADEILQEFITFSPSFCPVKLKEHSYPVVCSSFSGTSFSLDYFKQPDGRVVSKLIYVSSKDRYVYVSSSSLRSSSLHVRYRITEFATYHNPVRYMYLVEN